MKRHSNLSLSRHYPMVKVANRSTISWSFALLFHEKKSPRARPGERLNSFVGTDIADAGSSEESATAAPDSPCSPAEAGATTAAAAPSNEQQEQQTQHQPYQHQTQYQQQQHAAGNITTAASHVAEDSGAPCEMRRTPPQNKGKSFSIFKYHRFIHLFSSICISNIYSLTGLTHIFTYNSIEEFLYNGLHFFRFQMGNGWRIYKFHRLTCSILDRSIGWYMTLYISNDCNIQWYVTKCVFWLLAFWSFLLLFLNNV